MLNFRVIQGVVVLLRQKLVAMGPVEQKQRQALQNQDFQYGLLYS